MFDTPVQLYQPFLILTCSFKMINSVTEIYFSVLILKNWMFFCILCGYFWTKRSITVLVEAGPAQRLPPSGGLLPFSLLCLKQKILEWFHSHPLSLLTLFCGVPQGSRLGFLLISLSLHQLICRYFLLSYADDQHANFYFSPNSCRLCWWA